MVLRIFLLAGVACAAAATAQAQVTPPLATDAAQATSEGGLADIVVTAQKRSESLLNVPLSITAQSGDALANKGVTRIEQLGEITPGLAINNATGSTQIYLRGIGNSLYASTAESSVAIFVDGVPRPNAYAASDLANLERVEVLKGPQGTLYGRNASGGAINFITRQPSDKLEARATFSFGDYRTLEANGYVNVPLSDTLAANFSASRRYHRPFLKNLATSVPFDRFSGGKNFDQDFGSVDGKIRLESGPLTATVSLDYSDKDDANGFGWQQRDYATTLAYYQGLRAAFGFPALPPGFTFQRNLARNEVTMDQPSLTQVTEKGVALHADYDVGAATISLVSSYRKLTSHGSVEIDATPVPVAGFGSHYKTTTQSHELRAASQGAGPLHWLIGGSYLRSRGNDGILGLVLGITSPAFNIFSSQLINSYAVFGELGYDVTDEFSITGSLRYLIEKKDIVYPSQPSTGGIEFDASRTQKKLLPSLTFNYKVAPDQLLYLRAARGFKSGGFNTLLNPAAIGGVVNEFEPEVIDTIEGGYKAALFDRRVQLTAAVFYNRLKNLQISRTAGPGATNFVLNAKLARTYGAEASLTVRVAQPLTISASLAYINSKYQNYQGQALSGPPFNNSGNQMQFTPKWSGDVSADLAQPISDNLVLAGTANVSFKSKYNTEAQENPLLDVRSFALVNGRIGLRTADEMVGAFIFARNLFNKKWIQSGQQNDAGVLVTFGPPRVIGGTVEFKF